MIELRDIEIRFTSSDFSLTIPDLHIAPGEKTAVVGPSGSGKTTLLNLIAGILLPDSGVVQVDGHILNKQDDKARRDFRIANIGFILQDFGLLDYLTVMDNILHPFRITGAMKLTAQVREQAHQLASQMGIAGRLKQYPAQLSHGERQRVAICRSLLTTPKLILADEATGNLDPRNKVKILELLFSCVDEYGATLLAVTHDRDLLPYFDRVVDFSQFTLEVANNG